MAVASDTSINLVEGERHEMSLTKLDCEPTMTFKMAPSHKNIRAISNSLLGERIHEIAGSMYTLPENWPKIAQLKEHHWISELSNCKTPSVRRAVSHIELVQNIIDEWLLRVMEEVNSRTDSQYGSTPEKKQLMFQTAPEENSLVVCDSHSHRTSSSSKVLLSVAHDMTLTGQHGQSHKEDDSQEIPDLGAQEVIVEVITLLAELENDRLETLDKYTKESQRAELLRQKIDGLQLHHLQELPALVQREHEACLMDLTELHWHVTYTRRLQDRVQARFSVSNKHNVQLREGIDFVKQHTPLVQEKLVLEVEAMDKIRKAQGETDQELVMAQQRQTKTEVRSREAMTKANTERGHIKVELDTARDDLTYISQQLLKAQMTYSAYVHQMYDIHGRLASNERETQVLKGRNDSAKISEEVQATKVRNLQAKVTEAEFDHRHSEAENQRQEQVLNINKDKHTNALVSLEQQRKALDVQLWKLARKNQEQNIDIQDCEEKIAKCNQQKAADLKNITRMNQELERTSILLQQTLDQHHHFFDINFQLKEKLQSEQYQTFQTEEKLKKTCESLKRQIQEEIHTRTVLEARISSDLSETEKVKFDLEKKKEKAKAMTDELAQALSVVVQKVTKLQATRADMQQKREDLSTKIAETENQHRESTERFSQTLGRIEPHHQAVKSQLSGLKEQLQTMDEQSKRMKKTMEEMDAAQIMMDRVAKGLGLDIQNLMAEMHELNLQIESDRKIVDNLRTQFNNAMERLRDNEISHGRLQKERQEVLGVQETDKVELVEKNKRLASRYRQLQQDYIIQKELMLRSYDERVKLEAAITDMKQLKSFQSKLHSALVDYFKYRGLHNKSELSKLEQESSRNGVRVSELQVNMERALEDIARFLGSQKEGKMAKHSVREDAKEGKGSPPVPLMEGGVNSTRLGLTEQLHLQPSVTG